VAAVATAISLISQTYQLQGTFSDFMRTWLLLSIAIVYLLRTTLGAIAYVIGCVVWLFATRGMFSPEGNPMLFWLLLVLVIPYVAIRFRLDRAGRKTAILVIILALASLFGVGATADFANANVGALAYAGLATAIYLCGMKFFPQTTGRLHPLAVVGGIAIGVVTIVLSFESNWHMTYRFSRNSAANLAVAVELLFPIAAVCLAGFDLLGRRAAFSLSAALLPIVAAVAWALTHLCELPDDKWHSTSCSFAAAIVMNCYALLLGIDILARGIRRNSIARANFGLLLIAALAICRFFDSDLSFVARGVGFIIVGLGFLVANLLLFKRRTAP